MPSPFMDGSRVLALSELRALLSYNPCTGIFTWKKLGGKKKAIRAGNSEWRPRIVIAGKSYAVSRLAWYFTYGHWPGVVDHIDRNPRNNSVWNLANGTQSDNMRNRYDYVGGRVAARRKQDYLKARVRAFTFYARN